MDGELASSPKDTAAATIERANHKQRGVCGCMLGLAYVMDLFCGACMSGVHSALRVLCVSHSTQIAVCTVSVVSVYM